MREYNAARIYATGSGSAVTLGYELLKREAGRRRWTVVGKTESYDEARAWAARSGYRLPRPRTWSTEAEDRGPTAEQELDAEARHAAYKAARANGEASEEGDE